MNFFRSRKINNKNHICSFVADSASYSFLPKISRKASWILRLFRAFRASILISEHNPQTYSFYRSKGQIYKIRKLHAKSRSLMIHPFSTFQAKYEIWLTFLFFVVLFYLPLEASFDLPKPLELDTSKTDPNFSFLRHGFRPSLFIIKVLLIINIVMTFRTGQAIQDKGKVIMKPKIIAKKYATSMRFYIDILTALPEMFLRTHHSQRIVNILGALIIFKVSTFSVYFGRSMDFLQWKSPKLDILKHVIVNCAIIHWFACLQYLIPQLSLLTGGVLNAKCWLIQWDILNMSFSEKYLCCLYRAIGSLLCVDFEEVAVIITPERILAIATYSFGIMYTTYISALLIHYILGSRSMEVKYYKTMSEVQAYMSHKHLPAHMQEKVIQIYKYKYNKRFFKDQSTIGLLSEKLKSEINLSICNKFISKVQILSNLPENTLEQIIGSMKSEIFLTNDMIIKSGSSGDCMYFLASGTVAVWTPSGKEVCHLQDGAYFGEISLIFQEKRRTADIMALEICEVYKLDRRGFRHFFPKDTPLYKILENVAIQRLSVTKMFEEVHARTFMESNRDS